MTPPYGSMEKPPIIKDYIEHDCGCRRWYEFVPAEPVEELTEVVEYCAIHEIESDSS
jgi:hypothetical protein